MTLHSPATISLAPELRAAYRALIEDYAGIRLNPAQVRGLDALIGELLARTSGQLSAAELYRAFVVGEHPDLFADFAARLTIGETHFFRVAPQIAALREVILPELLRRRADERRLNIWSAGCSTGEEPYTLAILLRELLPAADQWSLRLLGTDLSEPALDAARRATYREWSFRETPAWVRERYFAADGAAWRLHESIRRMVRFERLNLLAEPYPAALRAADSLDLILCRNVTIYFAAPVTQRIYRRFAELLAPGGWLVVGPSDPSPQGCGFEPVYLTNAIIWRKTSERPRVPLAESWSPPAALSTPPASPRLTPARRTPAAPRPPRVTPPPDETPDRRLAAIHAQAERGELAVARDALAVLVRDAPLLVAAHRFLGLLALEAGDGSEAIESLRRATFLDADDPLAQFGLGRAYLALGDGGRASAAFRQARRALAPLQPDDAVPGDAALSVDKLRRAIEAQLSSLGDSGGERR